MKKRQLGQSSLFISPLCFGGNVFGWTLNENESHKILDAFIDHGFEFVDTADVYSRWKPGNVGGESEAILGNWFKKSGKRQKIILATKVGYDMGDGKKGLTKKYILNAVEESLRRLQTDYVDLYQSHTDDQTVSLEETLAAFTQLIKEGKVRVIGASNYTGKRLEESILTSQKLKIAQYQSIQPLYNLLERKDYETSIEPICVKHKVGVITYFSLASGFLTGKYQSEKDLENSLRAERVRKYLNPRSFAIVDKVVEVARKINTTPAQVALAWLISRPSVTAPIASATNLDQLQELVSATHLELGPEYIRALDEVSL